MGGEEERPDDDVAAESDEEEIAEPSTALGVERSPSDGGVWFVLEKASLEVAKVGKVLNVLDTEFRRI